MSLYERNTPNDTQQDSCACMSKYGFTLSARSMSWLVSGALLLSFFIFITGYFLGKKKATEEMVQTFVHESLSDHIYASMCSMYEYKGVEGQEEPDEALCCSCDGDVEQFTRRECDPACEQTEAQVCEPAVEKVTQNNERHAVAAREEQESSLAAVVPAAVYKAQLIGFGTLRSAQAFSRKLERKGIITTVKRRRSKTAKGRLISWYQVVTKPFDRKDILEKLVERLKQEEKLHDVRIVTC